MGVWGGGAHARYNYEIVGHASWEAFAQGQSDVFQRIKNRNLFGTGPRIALYQDKEMGPFLGIAYMFERDVIDLAPGAPEARVQVAHRISSYLSARAMLRDGIDAVTTTYAQPRVDDAGDIRVQSESGFVFKVSTWLSLSISFVAHYDSRPPTAVLPTDTELRAC